MVPRCQVEVLYFAKSAEITGIRSETISVPQEIKALQLWNEIEMRHSGLADVRNQVIFAVPQECVELGGQLLLLQSGDEIAIIRAPPPPLVEDSAFEPRGKNINEVEEKSKGSCPMLGGAEPARSSSPRRTRLKPLKAAARALAALSAQSCTRSPAESCVSAGA
ncbi:molybdopterin synthase sulfur carrier subunit-like [Balaenoptera musculus]|uniref:Molybdopterin synthase sulfur carrier subunit-like n=1 Tax=Balaenoptera musculus TaxID=9771 RepID=A0A8B8XJW8_BALMU|nr:molybdopterin synthase sulfur carrier subunit-like [Balaenoptera musculus]